MSADTRYTIVKAWLGYETAKWAVYFGGVTGQYLGSRETFEAACNLRDKHIAKRMKEISGKENRW